MKTDFKVYPRKIHVYRANNALDQVNGDLYPWIYAWSTNAHKTCKSAISDAVKAYPAVKFTANFSK